MLEDFLVWRVSPLEIKTILRYGHAKTIEDLRAYLTGAERARGGAGKWIMLIIIAIICMVGGIIFIMFGPKLLSGFMGGGGGA
jgi:hypothetical protein